MGLIGMGLFFLSGVGDHIWHTLFGVDRDLEAFLSPSHLLLVIGMALLVVLGGLVADWLVLRLRPSGERIAMFRTFAALAPLALWAIYFVVLAIAHDIGWPVELAVGVGIVSGMSTLMLAYLMVPTPIRVLGDGSAPFEAREPVAATAGSDG